ncbi:major facilitator superfamily domain-containing protein 6-B-like [Pollicipes pollicipes]|uniref:major facilitator superfamily domain-containing protein 6-B-like n=1 Tax=Pollicipes pollicipes TaxID=41117 RepID=UPI0018855FE2|nr:major facilitator superfamily domain-containing protein 6-B-like [Pollicipes pollicipes]
MASAISILPLLTLHMTALGLTYKDVAQVYFFNPIASFVGPPTIDRVNYAPAFYSMDLCVLLTIVTLFAFDLQVALPAKARIKELAKIFKRPEALVYVIIVTILGTMWGFLESFLFVFLKGLNAPLYMLGLTLTAAGLASLPFNWWSDAICRKVGHINILIASFAGYAVRYIGYSFIRNPWLCFPFELLEAVTTHLMWNSAATYAAYLAPPGLLATLTGVAAALHYSVGRGVGSFIGGYLMALSGPAFTFRTMGVASGVSGVLYAIVYYGCLRQRISQREERQRAEGATNYAASEASSHELATVQEVRSVDAA